MLIVFSHILSRKCVCMCVFSCSWRFTFYLLAFIAGLAALIDVSSAMWLSTPPLPLSPNVHILTLIGHQSSLLFPQ